MQQSCKITNIHTHEHALNKRRQPYREYAVDQPLTLLNVMVLQLLSKRRPAVDMPSIIVDNPLGPMVQNRSEMLQWWNVLNRAEQCWNLAFDGFETFCKQFS